MKIKAYLVVMLCSFLFVACGSNKKLKPPKKSPCACYDVKMDMENTHV